MNSIFLIGKGVTYDTGGADIKYGGVMRGMSRDKCGAAACAGFMKTISYLKPKNVNVIADLGFVRNSAGPDNYVSDEIIVSRAGVRVLIGNTDAEGRMVMGGIIFVSCFIFCTKVLYKTIDFVRFIGTSQRKSPFVSL